MASSNIDYSDYRKIAPPYDEPPRQRGCFFYGCLIAIVLSLLLLLAVGVILVLFYQWAGGVVREYTATSPIELPRVEMPAGQLTSLKERRDAFRNDVEASRPTPPLVLNADEINALLQDDPRWKGRLYVAIDGDHLKGKVSIPLSELPLLGLTKGRYLNGEAELKASLEEGVLIVTLESIEVNGKKLPAELMNQLRNQNLAKDFYKDERTAGEIRKYQSLAIKDGKVIITARDPTRASEGLHREEAPRIEARDGKVIVHPPGELPDLPDDVFAPPGPVPAVPIESTPRP